MDGLEFYIYDQELWCKHSDGRNEIVNEDSTEIVGYVLERIKEYYPGAFKALESYYSKSSLNIPYYKYLMVRRFIKCNFSQLNTTTYDIENVSYYGKFNFEKVECPLRGECRFENVICCPKFNNHLSNAETMVMEQVYNGLTRDEIAQMLYNSPETIKRHIRNSYVKLGCRNKADFIKLANDTNMFKSAQDK